MSNSHFRADIQGLRAIAVLGVVIFHIWPTSLTGGFLGVDMFFVISGYLITGNILRHRDENRFSFVNFYTARIKRLLPAVSFLLLCVMIAGAFILMPSDYADLAKSAAFASVSAANIYYAFALSSNYFAHSSAEQPLLHLWSLGVEEQFYLIWPFCLVILLQLKFLKLWRGWAAFAVVVAGAIASFILGELTAATKPQFSYYLLPTRASQLLSGAALAMGFRLAAQAPGGLWAAPSLVRNALAISGLAGVAVCFIMQNGWDGFPGISALPITFATLALLAAGHFGANAAAPVLNNRLAQWFGDTSYSLYLWHWPVLAFGLYTYVEIGLVVGLLMFAFMIAMASVSYYYIEKPLRHTDYSLSKSAAVYLAAPALLFCTVAIVLTITDGRPPLIAKAVVETPHKTITNTSKGEGVCQRPLIKPEYMTSDECVINGRDNQAPKILMWGDSNSAHFVHLIKQFANTEDFAFRNVAHSACPPIFGDSHQFTSYVYEKRCKRSRPIVHASLDDYDTIIMSGYWQFYYTRNPAFIDTLKATIDRLTSQGKHIIVMSNIQHFAGLNHYCDQRAQRLSFINCQERFSAREPVSFSMNDTLKAIAENNEAVEFFDVNAYICPNGKCSAFLDGEQVYYDRGHLSVEGAAQLGRIIIEKNNGAPAPFDTLSR